MYETKSQFLERAAKMTNAYQLDEEGKRENSNNQNQKGKNDGTHPSKVKNFRWLLRNGMNKTNIEGLKQKF